MAIRVGRLEVETPDHVVLRYTLAGVGNRGFAAVVDFLIALLITAGLEVGYGQIGSPGATVFGGSIRFLLFVLGWSYFIVLEWLWNGQTIGKRAYGLRVINEDGSPAGFVAVFVRNLVRMIDFLPALYGLGLLAIVFTPRSQRLGDLAAGTFVVRAPKPQLDWLSLRTVTRATAPVAAAGVRGLSGEAQRIVREFVAREPTLAPRDRSRLATEIASRIRPYTSGIDAPDDVAFLRALAATLREAGERRP
ncbi:MAG TPA: RDD family protein [Candidatus Limnocylindria bacterium]